MTDDRNSRVRQGELSSGFARLEGIASRQRIRRL